MTETKDTPKPKRRPPCENGDCADHYGDPIAWCVRCTPEPFVTTDPPWTKSDRDAEVARVEQVMTVEEIFSAGFHAGRTNAGVASRPALPFIEWLEARLERRVR